MGLNGTVRDFITLLRTVRSLKLRDCLFLEFPFNIFGPWLTVTETVERETVDKGEGNHCTVRSHWEDNFKKFKSRTVLAVCTAGFTEWSHGMVECEALSACDWDRISSRVCVA